MDLKDCKIGTAAPVSDLARARDFYEGKLGFEPGEIQGDGMVAYPLGGGTGLMVYVSDHAGTNKATLAGFALVVAVVMSDSFAFRAEARAWLTENLAAWRESCGGEPASGDTRAGFDQHLRWEQRLFAGRWAAVSWPEAYGGRDASLWEWLIFEEEYYRAGAPPRVTQNGIFLLAPSVFEFGTQAQQDALLPRMARTDDLWCQGWSEPDSGSDLASLSSRARRVDGGWVLDGQKTWTTRGAFCRRMPTTSSPHLSPMYAHRCAFLVRLLPGTRNFTPVSASRTRSCHTAVGG